MRSEVVEIVRQLALENRPRFRASYVADRARVSVDEARRDLVRLASAGELAMNFELLCPFDDSTVATFAEREQIPATYASDECGDGEEFEVTPELIWVTFSPVDSFRAEVEAEEAQSREDPRSADTPGNRRGPRRGRAARASTGSRTISAAHPTVR